MSSETLVGSTALAATGGEATSNLGGRKTRAKVAQWLLFLATAFAIVILAALIWDVVASGGRWLSWHPLDESAVAYTRKIRLSPCPDRNDLRHGLDVDICVSNRHWRGCLP